MIFLRSLGNFDKYTGFTLDPERIVLRSYFKSSNKFKVICVSRLTSSSAFSNFFLLFEVSTDLLFNLKLDLYSFAI